MASATFTVEGGASAGGTTATAGQTIDLAVADTTGALSVAWSVLGSSDPNVTDPTIATAGTPDGVTASFTMPTPANSAQGYSVIVKCIVNGGTSGGVVDSSLTATAIIGVVNANGDIPMAYGETTERSLTHAFIPFLNSSLGSMRPVVSARSTITTTDAATVNTIATIATSSEYLYLISAIVTSRQDSSSNEAFEHQRFIYTNKGGTLAQLGSDDPDGLNTDNITLTGLSHTTSSTNVLVQFQGKLATTVRSEYVVEYVALQIATS